MTGIDVTVLDRDTGVHRQVEDTSCEAELDTDQKVQEDKIWDSSEWLSLLQRWEGE